MSGPGRPLLVFDGDCRFCTSSAEFGRRRLGLEHVTPWQFLELADLGLAEAQCQAAVQWVAVDGSTCAGEQAIVAALRHAGGAWKVLGEVLDLPGVRKLSAAVYRFVARHRDRMPGGTAACRLPERP